ncbi:ABC transporter ATP-binding protein, partial [Pseudomonas syringae pv. tagetis]
MTVSFDGDKEVDNQNFYVEVNHLQVE